MRFKIRESLTDKQQKSFAYNQKQSVGGPLKTLNGSAIKRSRYGVGKEIGGKIYLHRNYAEDVIPSDIYNRAKQVLKQEYPNFKYNCVEWGLKDHSVRFDEAPGFDKQREPIVGDYVTVFEDGSTKKGHTDYIWHHKWLWVKDDYKGFDVAKSWEWSRKWLNTLNGRTYDVGGKQYSDRGVADGNGRARWDAQMDAYGLPKDESYKGKTGDGQGDLSLKKAKQYLKDHPEIFGVCYQYDCKNKLNQAFPNDGIEVLKAIKDGETLKARLAMDIGHNTRPSDIRLNCIYNKQ